MAELLVVEAVDQDPHPALGAPVAFYRAAVPLSRKTLNYVAGIIRRHRKPVGSRRRKLNPGQQGLLVLACLRKDETFADVAAGFGVTTAWRYIDEVVALLAARAPNLRAAVRDAKQAGSCWSARLRTCSSSSSHGGNPTVRLPSPEVVQAARTGQGWHCALVKRATMSGAASGEDVR
jgi:hypothetical protein